MQLAHGNIHTSPPTSTVSDCPLLQGVVLPFYALNIPDTLLQKYLNETGLSPTPPPPCHSNKNLMPPSPAHSQSIETRL
ncbi:hypothetical protein BC830DRAFT_566795 [Chytriomyces sp. MP71]|nr:hypothetical protein BC830DRAFT_566795 [Chytriomyces sp. MP71]